VTPRDEIWVDMTQFDTEVADAVWDGTHRDRSAPPWYRDVRSLIHRARGPAEAHELADEPAVIEAMGWTARGHHMARADTRARGPRQSGVRTLGRVVAMKAAAATTATLIGVTAAAAATTGIMATVAATVVVPAVRDHVAPLIGEQFTPTIVHETTPTSSGHESEAHGTQVSPCPVGAGVACGAPDPGTAGALSPDASTPPDASPPADEPVAATPGPAEAPAEEPPGEVVPLVEDPVATEAVPVEPEPVADDAAEEPTPPDPEPLDAPAVDPPTAVGPAPPGDPAPPAERTPRVDPGDDHGTSGSPAVDDGVGEHGQGETHPDGRPAEVESPTA
jgi:hypothetical protein